MERHIPHRRNRNLTTGLRGPNDTMTTDIIIYGFLHIVLLPAHHYRRSPLGEPGDKVKVLDLNLQSVNPDLKRSNLRVPLADEVLHESRLPTHSVCPEIEV